MPKFASTFERQQWASPEELDTVLRANARLDGKLESRTNPVIYVAIGAIGGILYYMSRQQQMSSAVQANLASAIESLPISI